MLVSKLYVRNLKYSFNNIHKLVELFSNYGIVKKLNIIKGKDFGFVEMSSIEEAKKAKKALNNYYFEGELLKVAEAWPLNDIRVY